jgi:hypothetical protein
MLTGEKCPTGEPKDSLVKASGFLFVAGWHDRMVQLDRHQQNSLNCQESTTAERYHDHMR